MPSGIHSADLGFPKFTGKESTEQKIAIIQNYLFLLLEQLRYTLENLDTSNWNASALDGFVKEIRAGVVTAQTVISNTVITNTLAAENATIAELTVDRLDTSTKAKKYLAGDTTDVNYIKVQGQTIQFITASTDGSATEQATDRNGSAMYWTDGTHAAAGTAVTAYAVITYTYTELIKAEISFVLDGATYIPKITLGAGSGTGNNGKSYIYKGTDGLYLDRTTTTGELMRVKLGDQCIAATGMDYCQAAKNTAAVAVSSAEVTAATKSITLEVRSRLVVMFSAEVTISGGAAEVTAKTYIDSAAQTYQPTLYCASEKPYVFTYIDAKEGLPAGDYTVSIALLTDVNTANISIGHAALIVQAFAAPLPTLTDPTGFAATANGSSEIDLAWTNPTESYFTEVELYRYSSSLESYDRAWCNTNATLAYHGTAASYNDTGLSAETAYFYKLFAVHTIDEAAHYSAGVIASGTTEESTGATKGYVFGGERSGGTKLQNCDEYSPDTWTSKTDMPSPARGGLAASTISNKGYIYGGVDSSRYRDCDEYSPDTWTSKTDMPLPTRFGLTASTISEKGYVYGGRDSSTLPDCDEYSPDTWTSKTDMPSPARTQMAASTINAKGYTFGGYSTYSDCDEYSPDTWTSKTDMPSPGRCQLASAVISEKAYIYGGYGASTYQDCDEYSPDTWASKTNMPSPARRLLSGCSILAKCYAYGGAPSYLLDCDEYSPDTWTNKTDMPSPARNQSAASGL